MKKKLICFILAFVLVLPLAPVPAGLPGGAVLAAPEDSVTISAQTLAEELGNEFIVGDIRVQTLSETLVRIELKGPKGFEDRSTYHIIGREKYDGLSATSTKIDGNTRIETSRYRVEIPDGATTLSGVTVTDPSGRKLWEYNYKSVPTSEVFLPDPGNTPSAWALSDNPRVYMPPWGYSKAPDPLPDDAGPFDLNGWDNTNNSADMYVFVPMGDAKQLRKDFTTLTGETQLIPFKALGLWHSRFNKYLRNGFLALIDEYREKGFPLDYMVVDTDWRSGSNGTGYALATDVFPPTVPGDDYSGLKEFLTETLPARNIQTIFNDHPVTSGNNRLSLNPVEVAFRTSNLTQYLGLGLDAWWYDRNWNGSISAPMPGINKESFGMYLYTDIADRFFKTHPDYIDRGGKRPFMMGNIDGVDNSAWVRPPNVSSHRTAFQWTGDTDCTNGDLREDIEALVRSGALTSNPYISSDLTGHNFHAASPQFVRWMQFGAFTPIMRFHSYSPVYREPFKQGTLAADVSREYVSMRYRLIPLLYSLSHENNETGMPLARRLDYNYPAYPEAQSDTQYTLGDGILVAPIYEAMQSGQESFVSSKAPTTITSTMTTPVTMNNTNSVTATGRRWEGTFTNTGTEEICIIFYNDRAALAWMNDDGNFGAYEPISGTQMDGTYPVNYAPVSNVPTAYFPDAYPKKDLVLERPAEEKMGSGNGLAYGHRIASYLGFIKPGETKHVRVVLPTQNMRNSGTNTWAQAFQYVRKEQMNDTRNVFIPDGRWINVWNGDIVEGPKTISVTHGMETSPLFVRAGTIIPLMTNLKDNGETIASSEDSPWTELSVDVYPSAVLSATQTLYEDDGVSNAYKKESGGVRTTNLSTSFDKATDEVVVRIGAAKGDYEPFFDNQTKFNARTWNVRVHVPKDWGGLTGVTVGGAPVTGYSVIPQNTRTMPFAYKGAACDGDVIELVIPNAALSVSHEIRLKFASYVKETISEFSGEKIDYSIDKKILGGTANFTEFGQWDWVHYSTDALNENTKKLGIAQNDRLISELTATGIPSRASSETVKCGWDDGNGAPAQRNDVASGISVPAGGSFEFDVKVDKRESEITLFVGGTNAGGRIVVTDGLSAQFIDLSGVFSNRVRIQATAEKAASLHIRFYTDTGSITLYGVAVGAPMDSTPVPIERFVSIEPIRGTVDLTAGSIDWVHAGVVPGNPYSGDGVHGYYNRKANVPQLLDTSQLFANTSGVGFSDFNYGGNRYNQASAGRVGGAGLSYTDGINPEKFERGGQGLTSTANGSADSLSGSIVITAPSTATWRQLRIYAGLWESTAMLEVFDEAGVELSKYQLNMPSGTGNLIRCISINFRSEKDTILYVKLYKTTGANVCLAGYALYDLEGDVRSHLSPVTSAIDLNGAADWVHPGAKDANSANRKAGVAEPERLLSGHSFSPTAVVSQRSDFVSEVNGITYSNGTDPVSVTGNRNGLSTVTASQWVEFTAQSSPTWRRLDVYASAFRATCRLEVFDAVTEKALASHVFLSSNNDTANIENQRLSVVYRSDASSPIRVRITREAQANAAGYVALGAYAVYDIDEPTGEAAVSMTDINGATVNLTQDNITDWTHYGTSTTSDMSRMEGVSPMIISAARSMMGTQHSNESSGVTIGVMGGTFDFVRGNDLTFNFNWSNGTPTASASNVTAFVHGRTGTGSNNYNARGMEFDVNIPRPGVWKISVYTSVWRAKGYVDFIDEAGSILGTTVYESLVPQNGPAGTEYRRIDLVYTTLRAGKVIVRNTPALAFDNFWGLISFAGATLEPVSNISVSEKIDIYQQDKFILVPRENMTVNMILAEYSSANMLVSASVQPVVLSEGKALSIEIPNIPDNTQNVYKLFFWEEGTYIPLTKSINYNE